MKVYNPENLELKDHSSCTELSQTLIHDCKLFYVEFIVEVLRIIDLYSADCIPRQCEMNKSSIGVWLILRREWGGGHSSLLCSCLTKLHRRSINFPPSREVGSYCFQRGVVSNV